MQSYSEIFKLLSDDTRLRIVMLLLEEDLCVCEMSGILNLPQPKISKTLSKLRDLRLVSDERREKFVFYSLNRKSNFFIDLLMLIKADATSTAQLVQDLERLRHKSSYVSQYELLADYKD
jgi:ArsR family transcriptional regulator